jgi:hypothetical protein
MLNNKSKLTVLAAALLFSFMTACSGEYQPARETPEGDSSALPDDSVQNNNMRNNMNDTSSNPGGTGTDTANRVR